MKRKLLGLLIAVLLLTIVFSGCNEQTEEEIVTVPASLNKLGLSLDDLIGNFEIWSVNYNESPHFVDTGIFKGTKILQMYNVTFFENYTSQITQMLIRYESKEKCKSVFDVYKTEISADFLQISTSIIGDESYFAVQNTTYYEYNITQYVLCFRMVDVLVILIGTPSSQEIFQYYGNTIESKINAILNSNYNGEETDPNDGDRRLLNSEYIGGKYNVSILHEEICYYSNYLIGYLDDPWVQVYEIKYAKDGMEYFSDWGLYDKDVFGWIKENTTENCTILCCWDYGHRVIGYAERNAIATFVSEPLKDFIFISNYLSGDELDKYANRHGGWNLHEPIEDIAKVLTSDNILSNETRDIIKKYNVSYLLTKRVDLQNVRIFFNVSNKIIDDYLYYENNKYNPTDKGSKTLIFKMWNDENNISGLNIIYDYDYPYDENYGIYSDWEDCRIFEVDISP